MATSGFGALFGHGAMSDSSPHGEERVFPAALALFGARSPDDASHRRENHEATEAAGMRERPGFQTPFQIRLAQPSLI